jgi:hypothetical protein
MTYGLKDIDKAAKAIMATPYTYVALLDESGKKLHGWSPLKDKEGYVKTKIAKYLCLETTEPGTYQVAGKQMRSDTVTICYIEKMGMQTKPQPKPQANPLDGMPLNILEDRANLKYETEYLRAQVKQLTAALEEKDKEIEELEEELAEIEAENAALTTQNQTLSEDPLKATIKEAAPLLMQTALPLLTGLLAKYAGPYMAAAQPAPETEPPIIPVYEAERTGTS